MSDHDDYVSDDFVLEDEPDYPSPCAVGDTVLVTGTLCNTNSVGGTAILEHGGTECTVTKAFWDYETGWRFHGRVIDPSATDEFRAQSTSKYLPEFYREKYPDQPQRYESAKAALEAFDPGYVYFSEHDLAPSLKPVR